VRMAIEKSKGVLDTLIKHIPVDPSSLSAQLIFSFVILALLTSAAAGLPAIWLIFNQLDNQAWAQVEQGRYASQALYIARKSEIMDLATLTAQRPTIREALLQGDLDALPDYLNTLQAGAGLDVIFVCDIDGGKSATAGRLFDPNLCAFDAPVGFYLIPSEDGTLTLLLAACPVETEITALGTVIAGVILDNGFAKQMRDQTGLEQTLIFAGQPVATSLAADPNDLEVRSLRETEAQPSGDMPRFTFSWDGTPYYAIRFPVDEAGLDVEVALSVSQIAATRLRLGWGLALSTLAVAVVGSMLGTLLTRRIGRTLSDLTDAAAAFSKGDLDQSVEVGTQIRELTVVAQALDRARVDLRQSLHQLRQEKAWTDQLIKSIVEGIVTLDHKGRISFFSHGAERITGWKEEEVLNHRCDDIFQPLESEEAFSQLIPLPGQRRRIPVRLAGEKVATLAITGARIAPLGVGQAEVVFVFRDISEEEAVHRLLGHFMANVSHEFRTPLSALAASIELLVDQVGELSTDELQQLLNSLHLGILRLQTLVDNILESASIETGHFRVSARASDLAEIIGEAAGIMQPLLDKRNQSILIDLPAALPIVQADSRRTLQVLVNLLSNASKYGPDESEIAVDAAVTDGWVRVNVIDRGPGVSLEHRQSVFRRFSHLTAGDGEIQYGAGLGLSVVRAIIEAHGGEVGVDEHVDGGAVFWFTLPVAGSR
jgi:PAS domain S-box-containing protein